MRNSTGVLAWTISLVAGLAVGLSSTSVFADSSFQTTWTYTDWSGTNYVWGVASTTGGSVYAVGNQSNNDVFLTRFDSLGNTTWSHLLGVSWSRAGKVAADGAGNAYVVGWHNVAGYQDGFIAKYSTSGNRLWLSQFGTSAEDEYAYGISVDSLSNTYAVGYTTGTMDVKYGTRDAFVTKYDTIGNPTWTHQLGVAGYETTAYGVCTDGLSGLYVTGTTTGALGGPAAGGLDAFIARYDASGTLLWTRQLGGTDYDVANAVTVDGQGNAYICGKTTWNVLGQSRFGFDDVFVAKYNSSGNLMWVNQFGTGGNDVGCDIATDNQGHIFVSGTDHTTPADPAFVAELNYSGELLWTSPVAVSAGCGYGVSADELGNVFVGGHMAYGGAFVTEIYVPEPTSLLLLGLAGVTFLRRRK